MAALRQARGRSAGLQASRGHGTLLCSRFILNVLLEETSGPSGAKPACLQAVERHLYGR